MSVIAAMIYIVYQNTSTTLRLLSKHGGKEREDYTIMCICCKNAVMLLIWNSFLVFLLHFVPTEVLYSYIFNPALFLLLFTG